MSDYKVKGSTIRSKFDYVEDHFGSEAKEKMIQEFKNRHGDSVFPILNSTWYSFDLYIETLDEKNWCQVNYPVMRTIMAAILKSLSPLQYQIAIFSKLVSAI